MEGVLARFRRRHALTQVEAAAVVGISASSWRQIETGWRGRKIPVALFRHLAALDLLGEHGIPWPDFSTGELHEMSFDEQIQAATQTGRDHDVPPDLRYKPQWKS